MIHSLLIQVAICLFLFYVPKPHILKGINNQEHISLKAYQASISFLLEPS
jgi:hypothetical protein